MKKLLYIMAIVATMLFTACDELDHAIADQGDRIEQLEKLTIKNVEDQVTAINASMEDLEAVDKELDNYIKALEAKVADYEKQVADLEKQIADGNSAAETKHAELEKEIKALKDLIDGLNSKDAELEKKIEDLKKYIDDEIAATEDWAQTTFATLEQYSEIQTEISEISTLISEQKTELTKAIEDAIDTLEASMQEWVNETLAEGYYDIAEIDAKLEALEKKLAGADDDLAKQIKDQQAALEQAKKDLTAAYEKAISDAIETNNGVIEKAIADAVEDVLEKVNTKLAVIDNTIAAIQKDIETLKASVEAFKEQIESINKSIEDLSKVDEELEKAIEALKNAGEYDEIVKALEKKDADLDKKIEDLTKSLDDIKKYIDDEIEGTVDWAEKTFATLEQFSDIEKALKDLDDLISQNKADLEKALGDAVKALQDQIDAIDTDIEKILERLGKIEEDLEKLEGEVTALKNRIQSIRFIPEYSDGKVEFLRKTTTLTFAVSPKSAAGKVTAEHLSAYIVRTAPRTRAAETPEELKIEGITGNEETGVIEVNVKSNELPADFWNDTDDANMYICISDGNNDIISEMIPTFYIPYVTLTSTTTKILSISPRYSSFEYSVDGGANWEKIGISQNPEGPYIEFGNGIDVLLRSSSTEGTSSSEDYHTTIKIDDIAPQTRSSSDGEVTCFGDIRTLAGWQNYKSGNGYFRRLFENCTALTDASGLKLLPENVYLKESCYASMFKGCTSLTAAPELPAKGLSDYCYYEMFSGCTNLVEAPELPAEILATGCYQSMFAGCTSLVEAPELPAERLVSYCYKSMFAGCTSLQSVTIKATDESATDCMADMFGDEDPNKYLEYDCEYKVSSGDELDNAIAKAPAGSTILLTSDLTLTDKVFTIGNNKELILNLNGKTLSHKSTKTGANVNFIDVRGTLTVKNGTITTEHTGTNMGWNSSTNVFNVTAGGVLNIQNAVCKNLGGSDMNFVAHLNNWGEVTLNVEGSELEATYVAVRVFNSGYDMNNVTIKNTILTGGRCIWVHNYTIEDFGTQEKADAQKALLNFNDILNAGNTFNYTKAAIRLGFTNAPEYDEKGNLL